MKKIKEMNTTTKIILVLFVLITIFMMLGDVSIKYTYGNNITEYATQEDIENQVMRDLIYNQEDDTGLLVTDRAILALYSFLMGVLVFYDFANTKDTNGIGFAKRTGLVVLFVWVPIILQFLKLIFKISFGGMDALFMWKPFLLYIRLTVFFMALGICTILLVKRMRIAIPLFWVYNYGAQFLVSMVINIMRNNSDEYIKPVYTKFSPLAYMSECYSNSAEMEKEADVLAGNDALFIYGLVGIVLFGVAYVLYKNALSKKAIEVNTKVNEEEETIVQEADEVLK